MEPKLENTTVVEHRAGSSQDESTHSSDDELVYPTGLRLYSILVPLGCCTFLVALDNTIVATAIPKITDEFKALEDVGWYGSAYLFALCAFLPFIGKLFSLLPVKTVYLTSLVIFEIGSAICGAAPNSTALIFGRAIAGMGAAGDFAGGLTIIAHTVPLEKRPMVTSLIGSSWAIACIAGPLIGGALTTRASWRWCFYINLPVGAVILSILFFSFKPPKTNLRKQNRSWKESVMRVDPLGTAIFFASVISLLLALSWGGSKYHWSNARIIALFIISGVLAIVFAFVEHRMQDNALIPLRILRQRSIQGSMFWNVCIGGIMYSMTYYLPIWFQAIKGASAFRSGVMIIPFLLGLCFATIISGTIVTKFGYYAPAMIVSSVVTAVGMGLLTTFKTTTNHSAWIGFQVLLGYGIGTGSQLPNICVQTVLTLADIPIGISVLMFIQLLGGSVFISVVNSVFLSRLEAGLRSEGAARTTSILNTGAVDLAKLGPGVQAVYNRALTQAWYVCVALAGISILGAAVVEWKSVKTPQKKPESKLESEEEKMGHGIAAQDTKAGLSQ